VKRSHERTVKRLTRKPIRPSEPRVRPKGRLLIIGGREDKEHQKLILRRLVELAGSGKLVVATVATEQPKESWEEYEQVFRGLGAPHVFHLAVETRAEARGARAMRALDDASAVFFTGGDQLKITSLLGDTPTYSRMLEIFIAGGVVAGTSAGASVMSDTMLIGGGENGSHRISSALRLAAGFGLLKDVVIDQHFAERGRISRLLAVVSHNPRIIGVGIDENTAIEVRPHREFRVLGSGGVAVIDGRRVSYTNVADEQSDRTMSLFGVTTHLLSQGDRFDLKTREPSAHPAQEIDDELGIDDSSESDE
jgi:cyanophycinase